MQYVKTFRLAFGLMIIGLLAFVWSLALGEAAVAWRAYLVNFLLFSAMAQGAVLFSAMTNTVQARWSLRLAPLAEAFSSFFPVSFLLFLGLFLGGENVFPWLHADLHHGKEVWLSLPFLFARDLLGLLLLYGLGFAYLYYALWFRLGKISGTSGLRAKMAALWQGKKPDPEAYAHRKYLFGILYLVAFTLVLSLLGYDLVMAAEPHWYSTLFGAYTFIKAIYIGFGALFILAACLHLSRKAAFQVSDSEYIDLGKLFLAFCLIWADFFYCQLVVIWYGNIPEETAYIITRTFIAPWNRIAWTVFAVCFVLPFITLLNRRIKAVPQAMIGLCSLVILGIWLEHYLLLGPALEVQTGGIPLTPADLFIALGFIGLLLATVLGFLKHFPELLQGPALETPAEEGDA